MTGVEGSAADLDSLVAGLARAALRLARAEATVLRAMAARDEATRAAVEAGVSQNLIAQVLGVKQGRVSQVVNGAPTTRDGRRAAKAAASS